MQPASETDEKSTMPPVVGDLQRLVDLQAAWEAGPVEDSFVQAARAAGADADELRKLDAWLMLQPLGAASPGRRLVAGLRWLSALMTLLGLVLGAGFMAALVAYDGSRQVNVLWLLGFAGLQLLLSLLALVYLLRGRERLPVLSELLGHLPGWLYRGPLRRFFEAPQAHDSALRCLHVPGLLLLTQRFALVFSLAALATLLAYVVLQDIAFGWATTLRITPAGLHAFVEAIALPWRWLWPAALPGHELVQASQFYRLAPTEIDDPAALGGWWPFLVMSWLVYAVLPRYLLLMLCRRRWGVACHGALIGHPDYRRTLARLYFDHAAARRESAALISKMLVDMLTRVESDESEQGDLATRRAALETRWRDWLRQREHLGFAELARIYLQQTTLAAAEIDVPDPARLFEIADWEKWGLNRKQVAMIAGVTGAAVGAGADAATGFSTLGGLAALGGVGAFAGVYLSDQIAETSSDSMKLRFGPVHNRQFPFALLGRVLSVWQQLAINVPGDSHRPSVRSNWQAILSNQQKRQLGKQFARVSKGESFAAQAELEKILYGLLKDLSED